MNQEKLKWCNNQKKGIELIELKPHLSISYINEAEETLENVFSAKGKWKLITAYYACYNALYSILMKCGIKCEIHDCTIELMDFFDFNKDEISYMKDLKDNRIQAQYYLKTVLLDDEEKVKKFILKCKTILNTITSEKIESVREDINKITEKIKNEKIH